MDVLPCVEKSVNGGIIVSFHDRKRISVLLENHNGMFVSDADMIACLDPLKLLCFVTGAYLPNTLSLISGLTMDFLT